MFKNAYLELDLWTATSVSIAPYKKFLMFQLTKKTDWQLLPKIFITLNVWKTEVAKFFDQKNYGSKLVMQIMTSKTFHGLNDVSWII